MLSTYGMYSMDHEWGIKRSKNWLSSDANVQKSTNQMQEWCQREGPNQKGYQAEIKLEWFPRLNQPCVSDLA